MKRSRNPGFRNPRITLRCMRATCLARKDKHATLPGLYISYTRQGAKIAFTILFLTFPASFLGALCVKRNTKALTTWRLTWRSLREKKYKNPGNVAAYLAHALCV
jgi:hypothetical protein